MEHSNPPVTSPTPINPHWSGSEEEEKGGDTRERVGLEKAGERERLVSHHIFAPGRTTPWSNERKIIWGWKNMERGEEDTYSRREMNRMNTQVL